MKALKYSMVLAILVCCVPAYAEFYKYTDETGKIRYTDDLSQVPEKQREQMKSYGAKEKSQTPAKESEEAGQPEESSSEATAATPPASSDTDIVPIPEPSDNSKSENTDITELADTKKNLEKRKKDLENEYQALLKEQGNLLMTKGITGSQAAARAHNDKLARLNDKIVEYQKKLRALDNDIAAYNQKVEEQKKKDAQPAPENPENKE